MTIADSEWFTAKGKPITYIKAFVELYKWRNRKQVYEMHGMVELDKWHASIAENTFNLGAHCIIEVFLVLHSAHVIPRDQDKLVFYINNYINWD